MRSRVLALVVASIALLAPALGAKNREPQLYFFWSASCPYSKAAQTFLQGAKAKDPRLRIRDFEVDESDANTRLLGRLYERIGLPEFWVVPVIVVGHHVVIGYTDDETTGAEILVDVAECRKRGCKDAVRDLIEGEGRVDQVVASAPDMRVECKREPGRAIGSRLGHVHVGAGRLG
jgi:glutaredoxin